MTNEPVPDPLRQSLSIMAAKDAAIEKLTQDLVKARAELERVQRQAAVLRASVERNAASMDCCGGKVWHGDEHEDDCHAQAALASDAGKEYVPKEVAQELAEALRENSAGSFTRTTRSMAALEAYGEVHSEHRE